MNIDSTLKKEGIEVIAQLNNEEVNKIATNISQKIASAFPEHNINQENLFISITQLNMYIANMPKDSAVAKYFYKNNSIYFSKNANLDHIDTLAIHECIHFMQELKNSRGKLIRLGLYNRESVPESGMAINEAAVQHMASIAINAPTDNVKYFNMELNTESPDYYPIETALLNEMMYFTGTYPLYHSTFYSNDVFKNTFIAKSDERTYQLIEKNFDLLLKYESLLAKQTYKLSFSADEKSFNKIKAINEKIDSYKKIILEKTLETQNTILLSCFNNELNLVRNLDDVEEFKEKLNGFKNLIITTDNYNFFNSFSIDLLDRLEEKRQYIETYGEIVNLQSATLELAQIKEQTYGFQFFKNLFKKLNLLIEESIRSKSAYQDK